MNQIIELITGQADRAKQAAVEQDVEVHRPNRAVHVQTVQLSLQKLEPKAARLRLVERRRRRTRRQF